MAKNMYSTRGAHCATDISTQGSISRPCPAPRKGSTILPTRSTLLCLVLLLGGCGLGPEFQHPAAPLPAAYTAAPAGQAQPDLWPQDGWWRGFGSPELDRLIDQAMRANNDIAAAIARVRQADAAVSVAAAPLLPAISAAGAGSQTHYASLPLGLPGGGLDSRSFSATAGFSSYELDLWGRLRAIAQSAQATALANRFDAQTIALSVVGSVANSWTLALATKDRLEYARQNLRDAEELLRAINGRQLAGTASALDVAQQTTLVEQERANIPGLQSTLDQAVIALGILTGQPPEAITVRDATLGGLTLPPVAPGLPGSLLTRRPDIAFAEANLLGANASIRAARAAFFPTITLTGDGGWQSTVLSSLTNPANTLVSLSSGLTAPIFDNGLRAGTLDQARGREEELLANYRTAVLQALTDVENALTGLRYSTEQERLQANAVSAAQRAEMIARAQLDAGTIDITTLLSVETTLYTAQDSLAQVRLVRVQSQIALYKALGGGWQQTAPIETPSVPVPAPLAGTL